MTISPTTFNLSALLLVSDYFQFSYSFPSLSIKDTALLHFLSESSNSSVSFYSCAFAASNSSISCFICASTALNFSRAASHLAWAAAANSLATFSSSYFGFTTFIASSYWHIAFTHLERPNAALEAFSIFDSSYSSALIRGFNFSIFSGAMLSLS